MNDPQKSKRVILCVKNKELNVNANRCRSLKKRIISQLEKDYVIIELDFSNAHKIDASGIAQLLICYRKVTEVEGTLRIINVKSEYIKKFIELIHLDRILEIKFH